LFSLLQTWAGVAIMSRVISPNLPCDPPCKRRAMNGISWWKLLGYNAPCGCAYAAEMKFQRDKAGADE